MQWRIFYKSVLITCLFTFFSVISAANDNNTQTFPTIEWVDLIPQADLDALMDPPSWIDDIADGSPEDAITPADKKPVDDATQRYYQALTSSKVKTEYHNRKVRIAGFIVPLDFNAEQAMISFFLVPYFGACIHLPPPPPNQIIYVTYPKGLKFDFLMTPFWVEGTLETKSNTHELGASAYAMTAVNMTEYKE